MKCEFNESKECKEAELFDRWKDDKKETGWLTLGVCPECPVYRQDIDSDEVINEAT